MKIVSFKGNRALPCNSQEGVFVRTPLPCVVQFWWWIRHHLSNKIWIHWRQGWRVPVEKRYRMTSEKKYQWDCANHLITLLDFTMKTFIRIVIDTTLRNKKFSSTKKFYILLKKPSSLRLKGSRSFNYLQTNFRRNWQSKVYYLNY